MPRLITTDIRIPRIPNKAMRLILVMVGNNGRNKWLSAIGIILFYSILVSCRESGGNAWCSTVEDNVRIMVNEPLQEGRSIRWSGKTFDCVANGEGTVTILNNDGTVFKEYKVTAKYGATNTSFIKKLKGGAYFIGDSYDIKGRHFGVQFCEDNIYIGQFCGMVPDGKLNWYINGKPRYVGYWKDGMFDGQGTFYRDDGTKCSGIWQAGHIIQTDTVLATTNGVYKGFVKNGYADGYGVMIFNDSSYYNGYWTKGIVNGKGEFVSKLFKYKGQWRNGHQDGSGSMLFSNGDAYTGQWSNGEMSGYGEYSFAGLGLYKGCWKHGLQDGKGRLETPSGTYVGKWSNGNLTGSINIEYSNGDKYVGEYCDSIRAGVGSYAFKSGNRYDGQFAEGTFNGLGVFTFADGNWYEGEFAFGRIAGEGTLCYYDKEDSLQVAITAYWDGTTDFPSLASVLFSDGALYEGRIINGEPIDENGWSFIDFKNRSILQVGNDFYKDHKKMFSNVIKYTSYALEVSVIVSSILAVPETGGASLIAMEESVKAIRACRTIVESSIALASDAVDIYEAVERNDNLTAEVVKTTYDAGSLAVSFIDKSKKSDSPSAEQFIKDILSEEVNSSVMDALQVRDRLYTYITNYTKSEITARLKDHSKGLKQFVEVNVNPETKEYQKILVHCKYAYDKKYKKFTKC